VIDLAESAAREVHDTIAGKRTELARVLELPGTAWRIPLRPDTVYRIEGLCLLAAERGIEVRFVGTAGLDERAAAFVADLLSDRPGPGGSTVGRSRPLRSLGEALLLLREAGSALILARPAGSARRALDGERFEEVAVIGAYGGDHIGDAAILGGVLLRLHEAHGVRGAHVMSHRSHHTRRLVAGLETPVAVHVHDYRARVVDGVLDRADALVLAGGPLMDLPRVLAKHLAAVGAARGRGRPFLIEDVGVGPFKRRMSRWVARRIARAASRLSVRTSADAAHPLLAGLDVETGRDPAFRYLATRGVLGLLRAEEGRSIAALLRGTEGRLLVGVNLRPIRHLWDARGAAHSRAMEGRFYERLASGLGAFARRADPPVTLVFFPMNPIRFGGSDLAAAYQLHRLIGGAADLRVWEADPGVDGMLHLLRRLDLAVAMRLHACVFALSQGLPTLGIDYYPGQGGKVGQLFRDLGRPGDVRQIDAVDGEWLTERLAACVARVRAARGGGAHP
jgi:polysaccharide pyruvyl transferase WcaK-like protein